MGVEGRLSKLAHVSNLLGLVARAQSDLLYLQSFMVIASGTTALFNFLQPKPLLVPTAYSVTFTLMSAAIVGKIASERFVKLTPAEEAIYTAFFSETFDRPMFKKFFALSTGVHQTAAVTGEAGGSSESRTRVLAKGGKADLILLLDGHADITFSAPRHAVIPRGKGLIGEMGFTQATATEADEGHTAVADIDVLAGHSYVTWDVDVLRDAKAKDAALKKCLDLTIGLTLSQKLRSAWLEGAETAHALAEADHRDALLHMALDFLLEGGRQQTHAGSSRLFFQEAERFCAEQGVAREQHVRVLSKLGIVQDEAAKSGASLRDICQQIALATQPTHIKRWKTRRGASGTRDTHDGEPARARAEL